MAKLTDRQKKKIAAESATGSSTRALAAKYRVSQTTIRRVLQSDPALAQIVSQKKRENTESVLAFMDSRKNDVCALIDALLAAMNNPDKIAATPLNQLATTMGIVIDKFTANETRQPSDTAANNLFEAINSIGEEGLDDIPEIQQAAKDDAAVVENGEIQT